VNPEYAVELRAREHSWEIEDFACRRVGDGTYLVTYLLLQGERRSRRSTPGGLFTIREAAPD
jgi:hypothetical protein